MARGQGDQHRSIRSPGGRSSNQKVEVGFGEDDTGPTKFTTEILIFVIVSCLQKALLREEGQLSLMHSCGVSTLGSQRIPTGVEDGSEKVWSTEPP